LGRALLEAAGVEFAYDAGPPARAVFRGLDVAVEPGEFLGILGPNGSGKTTLLKLLCGLLSPARGEVRLDGRSLASLSPRARAREIAFVPPEAAADVPFTVLEAVLMGRFARQGAFAFDAEEDVAVARRSLERVDALAFEARFLFELSAGERQRVLVARALAQEPRVLLLDEPTSHLDVGHQVAMYALVEALNRESGLTVLVVSHDLNLAASHCRRLVLLDGGAVVRSGEPAEILKREVLEAVYRTPMEVGRHPSAGTPWIFPGRTEPPDLTRGDGPRAGAPPP
jgi:iron complex transport system ATP-binding protein